MSQEKLWAPWRLKYIVNASADKVGGCFFCRYRDEDRDAENFVVSRTARSFTVLNRYPYNNGHLMVAPLEHKPTLLDLDDEDLLDCVRSVRLMTKVLGKILTPEGFNIGLNLGVVAGAGVPGHLHWHVVPRWKGDTNFMAVIGETDVIPQSLSSLYEYLREELQASGG